MNNPNNFTRTISLIKFTSTLALAAGVLGGCESSDPDASAPVGGGGAAGAGAGCPVPADPGKGDAPSCQPRADDYVSSATATDGWPACVSDDGAFHPFGASVSTNARAAAFVEIATKLAFGGARAPSPQDFVDARVAYTASEGIESRVARREDEHYPPAPKACRDLAGPELAAHADRCVGQSKLQPMLNAAFEAGIAGHDPVENAARIEAALLWFFYVSAHKEARTCASTQADCDSSSGYYAGTQTRGEGVGLATYVRAASPQAHARVWDGLLAVRCWRDLDNPGGLAGDLALRDRAVAQLDRALLRGMALIVRHRAASASCSAAWETVKVLGPLLDREASARDASRAAVLRAEVARAGAAELDVAALTSALDAVFACP